MWCLCRLGGGGVSNQIDDAVRVAKLVVVPRDELDKVVVQLNARTGVEDGAAAVGVEVCQSNIQLDCSGLELSSYGTYK